MKYAVTAKEMKAYDKDTIERIGLSSEVLMERAALSVVEELQNTGRNIRRVLVAAGTGNNGGDGIAIGRLLLLKGIPADIYLAGERKKCTTQTLHQLQILENSGFSTLSKIENAEYDVVIDALFGIGLSREVTGDDRELIGWINSQRKKGTFVCAVDIPSGISADTGEVLGIGVKADLTVAFAFAKRGELLSPGREYTGRLKVWDIGITEKSFVIERPSTFYYEKEDIRRLLPKRPETGNKGTFGKVLLVAGNEEMSGACLLCGKSIFRTGAGMVKIITSAENRSLLQKALPEAMLYTWEGVFEEKKVQDSMDWADVIVIGPGLGTGKEQERLLAYMLQYAKRPVVVDADGLNLIAWKEGLKELAKKRGKEGKYPLIFTPHPGELLRLCGSDMAAYEKERMTLLKKTAKTYGAILAGKDAVTITVAPGQKEMAVNVSGNDGMATAGSGDVLAGVVGGLLAQGMEAFTATALGVYLHGLAGDHAALQKGRYGMMAGELADAVGDVLLQWIEDTGKEGRR